MISSQSACRKSAHSYNTADFRVLWTTWPHPFLTTPTIKLLRQLLALLNLLQHAENQFIPSIHSWNAILESHDQTGQAHFWSCSLKNFWSTFSLCELLSKWKISGYFTNLFCRYGWLKNFAIWLAEEILGHSSGKKTFFPNMGFVREHNT